MLKGLHKLRGVALPAGDQSFSPELVKEACARARQLAAICDVLEAGPARLESDDDLYFWERD